MPSALRPQFLIFLLLCTALCGRAAAQPNYTTPYYFTNLAGSIGGQGDVDGTSTAARFFSPNGVAVDSLGNVFVADTANHTVRKIAPTGVVTTFAGLPGQPGSTDGTGSTARFNEPSGVAVDNSGNVFVVDSRNDTIRTITPSGIVTTFAGLSGQSGSDDGTGSAARFDYPRSLTVDSVGNVFVADTGNSTIRKITPAGVVTTLAGVPRQAGSVDGTGSAARFSIPEGITVDATGNVFVADSNTHVIRKITPTGVVT